MNGKMRSSVMGLILGQFSSPLPEAQKEPVAYLYNGVSLQDIYKVYTPELQKTHPYAVIDYATNIAHSGDYFGRLYLCNAQATVASNNIASVQNVSYVQYFITNSELISNTLGSSKVDVWALHTGDHSDDLQISGDRLLWTNYNLLREDGTTYLAASDPIPVYE